MQRPTRPPKLRRAYDDLLGELNELREDNARLRMEATRPPALSDAVAQLTRVTPVEADDAVDEAQRLLAEAQRHRSTVRATLEQLRAACLILERQLDLGVGSMDLERRTAPRHDPPPAALTQDPDARGDRAVELAMQFARELRRDPASAQKLLERVMRSGEAFDLAIALGALVDVTHDPETLLAWTDPLATCAAELDGSDGSPHPHGSPERHRDGCRGRACVLAAQRAGQRPLSIAYPDEPTSTSVAFGARRQLS